jgi:transketolase
MGEGKRSLRDLLRAANAGETHLRTHEAIRIGGDGYGREHSPDLPTLRDAENEGGSQPSSESETSKIKFFGIEEVKNTNAFWKGKQMEAQDGRNNRPPEYNWRGFLESAQKGMEIAASKDGDPLLNAHRVAKVMASLYDATINATDIARVIHCYAIVHASQDPTNAEKHKRVVATAAILAELSKDTSDPDLAQLRVVSELANQLSGAIGTQGPQ